MSHIQFHIQYIAHWGSIATKLQLSSLAYLFITYFIRLLALELKERCTALVLQLKEGCTGEDTQLLLVRE